MAEKAKKISLEEALKDAPDFLNLLKEQIKLHNIEVSSISSKKNWHMYGTLTRDKIKLAYRDTFAERKVMGTYTISKLDGKIVSQTYDGVLPVCLHFMHDNRTDKLQIPFP